MSTRAIKWSIFISKGIWVYYLDPDLWLCQLEDENTLFRLFFEKVVQKNHSDCNFVALIHFSPLNLQFNFVAKLRLMLKHLYWNQ